MQLCHTLSFKGDYELKAVTSDLQNHQKKYFKAPKDLLSYNINITSTTQSSLKQTHTIHNAHVKISISKFLTKNVYIRPTQCLVNFLILF